MDIKNKTQPDPVAQLPTAEAYMRWALLAAEEVVGKQGLAIILRENNLERFIDHYPPENLKLSQAVSMGDYTSLCTGLLKFYGRAGKSVVIRIGRLSSKYAIDKQGKIFNIAARAAIKLMPLPAQIKATLDNIQDGFKKIYAEGSSDISIRIEDRGDKWAYIAESCPMCAGKEADSHICWSWNGSLKEATMWTTGKEFEVEEVECRAMGAPACIWEISKTPKE
jgi:predicted hydrocarbon binding protein